MQVPIHHRLLIVDDNERVADTVALVLKMQRYETRVAYSAERGCLRPGKSAMVSTQWRVHNLPQGIYEALVDEELNAVLQQHTELRSVFGKLDPDLAQRFQDAMNRLDVLQPAKAPAPGPGARLPLEAFPLGLDLLPAQAPEKPLPEAGSDFWKALKAAAKLEFTGNDGAINPSGNAPNIRKRSLASAR